MKQRTAHTVTNILDDLYKAYDNGYNQALIGGKYMNNLDKKIYSMNQSIRMGEVVYNKAIDECKQILLDAMARDGKTKCHEYIVAVNKMEKLKLQNFQGEK